METLAPDSSQRNAKRLQPKGKGECETDIFARSVLPLRHHCRGGLPHHLDCLMDSANEHAHAEAVLPNSTGPKCLASWRRGVAGVVSRWIWRTDLLM